VRLGSHVLIVLVAMALLACGNPSDGDGPSAAPEDVQQIIERRCYSCHSQNPTDAEFRNFDLPKWDDPDNVTTYKERIYEVVAVSKRMPQGNRTNMTQEERDRIAEWAKPG
jgi:uncharacterized membrane protein